MTSEPLRTRNIHFLQSLSNRLLSQGFTVQNLYGVDKIINLLFSGSLSLFKTKQTGPVTSMCFSLSDPHLDRHGDGGGSH